MFESNKDETLGLPRMENVGGIIDGWVDMEMSWQPKGKWNNEKDMLEVTLWAVSVVTEHLYNIWTFSKNITEWWENSSVNYHETLGTKTCQ